MSKQSIISISILGKNYEKKGRARGEERRGEEEREKERMNDSFLSFLVSMVLSLSFIK